MEILTGTGIKTYGDEFSLGGVQLGNVWIEYNRHWDTWRPYAADV